MPYIGNTAGNRFVASQAATRLSGNGSTTAFTLEHSVGSDEDILVSVDGVVQEPSIAYAVSNGTTLTFTAAPSSGTNNIFVCYLFRTVATVDHPSTSALSATSGTFSSTLNVTGEATLAKTTFSGSVSAGDDATVGGNAGDGLILTGQGSTSDITMKNDTATDVLTIPTGSTNVKLNAGNLVIGTSGKGIDFSANANASGMSSELLDDYEEGTFSPVFQTGGNSNGIGHSLSSGTYTKVGNRVMCGGIAAMNSKDSSSLTGGNVTIGGLPFTIINDNNSYSAAALRIQNISFADQCSLATVVGTTTLDFREITNSGSVTTLTDGNITSTSYVIFEIAYRVD